MEEDKYAKELEVAVRVVHVACALCGRVQERLLETSNDHVLSKDDDSPVTVAGDGLTDSLRGLSSIEVKSIVEWRDFYHKSYKYVGKLVGRYYDSQGNPTKYLKGVETKAARGAQLLEKQKIEEAKQPSCNSRWSQDEGGEVWCDIGYPRLVQRPLEIALTGKMSKRCACFEDSQLDQPGLEVYEGCERRATKCKL